MPRRVHHDRAYSSILTRCFASRRLLNGGSTFSNSRGWQPTPDKDRLGSLLRQQMMTTVLELRLRADIHAPGIARAALDQLAIGLPQSTFDDIRLLASELVANSVRHVQVGDGGHIDLAVEVSDEALRVAVSDEGPGFHPNAEVADTRNGRRGLWLVSRLAQRWGVDEGQRFTTWFEIDLSV